jgi:hypothetical protein
MIANIGQELRKLQEIDMKSSEMINKYMDGQLGLLELRKYQDSSRNSPKP